MIIRRGGANRLRERAPAPHVDALCRPRRRAPGSPPLPPAVVASACPRSPCRLHMDSPRPPLPPSVPPPAAVSRATRPSGCPVGARSEAPPAPCPPPAAPPAGSQVPAAPPPRSPRSPTALPDGLSMDIIRGSLEEISRPASSSRAHLGVPGLSTSLEVLTPEPGPPKAHATVESPSADRRVGPEGRQAEGSSGSNNGEREQCSRLSGPPQDCSEDRTGRDCHQLIQTPLPSDSSSSLGDSEDDCATAASSTPRKASLEPRIHVAEGTLKVKEADLRLQAAVQKMKRLDKLLVKKLSQEKEIKKQGQEMRTKLWADLRSVTYPGDLGRNEEIENTGKFWALTSSSEEAAAAAAGPSRCEEEDAVFRSVFHTQLPPRDYESRGGRGARLDPEREREAHESSDRAEEKPSSRDESELRANVRQDFIKRNIELAKDAGSQFVMMDEEKKRLVELLKASEDEGGDFPATEEEGSGWIVPGEGYTPEPTVRRQLAEIDAKLREVGSETVSEVPSFSSRLQDHLDQQGAPTPGMVPRDKALQRNKEERDQRNRLREIDRQLRALKGDPVEALPGLSEERFRFPLGKGCPASGLASGLVPPIPTAEPPLLPGLDGPSIQGMASSDEAGMGTLGSPRCSPPGFPPTKAPAGPCGPGATVDAEAPGPPGLAEEVEVAAPGDADNKGDVFMMSTLQGVGSLENPSFPEEVGCQASWTNDPDPSAGAPRSGLPRTPHAACLCGVPSPQEIPAPKRHTRKEEKENVREAVAAFPTPSSPQLPAEGERRSSRPPEGDTGQRREGGGEG
ncbi:fibrous sheath-interacting protein 1 [Tachyglossus aculeatus]|uniref:fibrous sheath-interacting protein 1 n=1 Tax=Tachyglossus aculeatus TaxID=9261 RepID=UPI0018F5947F|nr:fibrous sheath-interacting protein 1 [Tachyglossus aculeatus]